MYAHLVLGASRCDIVAPKVPAESFAAQFERHMVQAGFYILLEAPAESFSVHRDGVGTGYV